MRRKKSSKSDPRFADPEIQHIEQLLQFMSEHNLEEFEYSRGDVHIRLRKPSSGVVAVPPRAVAAPEIIVSGSGDEAPAIPGGAGSTGATTEARSTEDQHLVKSPIAGTFYDSPSPGA